MAPNADDTTHEDEGEEAKSKSQRKRDAIALQELGVELVALPSAALDRLPLPEKLRDAIDLAKRITTHGALFRQRQFIGKLMRHIDVEPIVAALEAKASAQAEAARSFHRLEQWRDRLVAEGEVALAAFAARYPAGDPARLRELVGRVHAQPEDGDRRTPLRALFRAVRAAVEAEASGGPSSEGPDGKPAGDAEA